MDFNVRMATAEEASHCLNIIDAIHAFFHLADDPDSEDFDDFKDFFAIAIDSIVARTYDKEKTSAELASEIVASSVAIITAYENVTGVHHGDVMERLQSELQQYVSGQN